MNLRSLRALIAGTFASVTLGSDKMTESGVPKRDGHRSKSPQRRKSGRFRRMMYIYGHAKLPKGIHAPGFQSYTNVGGQMYLVKHGTNYRLDRLARSGQVTFTAA
jgi:hypothetical protein